MSRLLIVSNRLPINIVKKDNTFTFQPSVGGVATGLDSISKSKDTLWIGWPGVALEKLKGQENNIKKKLRAEKFYPVYKSCKR